MTNVLVVLAHPNEASFNHAIAETAIAKLRENGHEVIFHDLYAEGFDPLLPTSEFPEGAPVTAQRNVYGIRNRAKSVAINAMLAKPSSRCYVAR